MWALAMDRNYWHKNSLVLEKRIEIALALITVWDTKRIHTVIRWRFYSAQLYGKTRVQWVDCYFWLISVDSRASKHKLEVTRLGQVVHTAMGRYVTQMDNIDCNITFTVTLTTRYRYLYFSYDIYWSKRPLFFLVTFPEILNKTGLRYRISNIWIT
jgi:hypothetical protein